MPRGYWLALTSVFGGDDLQECAGRVIDYLLDQVVREGEKSGYET